MEITFKGRTSKLLAAIALRKYIGFKVTTNPGQFAAKGAHGPGCEVRTARRQSGSSCRVTGVTGSEETSRRLFNFTKGECHDSSRKICYSNKERKRSKEGN